MMANESLALLTDLYQLTMAQAYFNDRKMDRATFSLFIRSYPLNRGFFISAGLHDVLKFLENFAVDGAALDYLSKQQLFYSTLGSYSQLWKSIAFVPQNAKAGRY